MSAGSKNCGSCGHPNSVDAMFCSKCGLRLPVKAARETPRALPASETAKPTSAEPPAPSGPTPVMSPAPSPSPSRPAPQPDAAVETRRRRVGTAKTMMGVPLSSAPPPSAGTPEVEVPKASAVPAPAEPVAPPRARTTTSGRTMLGMPAPDKAAVAAAIAGANAAPIDVDGETPPAWTPPSDPPPAEDGERISRPSKRRVQDLGPTQRTMLGQPAPKLPSEPPESESARPSVAPRERVHARYPAHSEDEIIVARKKGNRGLAIAVLGIGLLGLLVGGTFLALALWRSSGDVRAAVVQGEQGEMLELEVPGAPAGTRLRFHGSEQPLTAGRARFPLSADDLALGDNELSVDVVAPSGDVRTETVELHLEMRVRADLGALANAPPSFDVVVEAPAGSEAALDGEALTLDAHGRGTRRFPIEGAEANAQGIVEHRVRYRVALPDGQTAQGELHTRIPLTTLTIDRPGEQVVTDAASIQVAGAVAPGASVTVDGQDVPVQMGRFLRDVALESNGERTIEVVARAPGKAPRVARLRVRKVADLAAEAASFDANRALTYARIAQNPTTFRGQRVAFEGVVYNVDVREGRSVIQILVEPCPAGERCPLWVTYSAATEAELRSRVRVLGTVAGEQQFRSQSGQVRTVPRVDATFVLPAPQP